MAVLAKSSGMLSAPARGAICVSLAAAAHILLLSLVVLGDNSVGTGGPQALAMQLLEASDGAPAVPVTPPPQPADLDSRGAEPIELVGLSQRYRVPALGTGADWLNARGEPRRDAAVPASVAASQAVGPGRGEFVSDDEGEGRQSAAAQISDEPLSAGHGGNGAGANVGGRADGFGGTGSGGSGAGSLEGFADGGGGDALDRVLAKVAPVKRAAALALEGRPHYPRACRQGLCRRGRPCEGDSEWRITVAAAGGKPEKVECIKKLECELQNASIRKFFSEAKFPKTEKPTIYNFPVPMKIERE